MKTRNKLATLLATAALSLSTSASFAQPAVEESNPTGEGLPNPMPNRATDWAKRPPQVKAWGAVFGALPGPGGRLYVAHRCFENSCRNRAEPPVIVFDKTGQAVEAWGVGEFAFPHGFFIDRKGAIWFTDAAGAGTTTGGAGGGQGNQVLKYDSHGKRLMVLGKAGVAGNPEDGLFTQPTAVITNRRGEIFVAEGHDGNLANRISEFTAEGKFIKTIVTGGGAVGQVSIPHCLAFDSRERLFVCDRGNNRIQVFDQDGKPLAVWKQWGRPSGILMTANDRLYVTDSESGGSRNPGWKKGIRIGDARAGRVTGFIPDVEATVDGPAGAEGLGLYNGALFGAVVRRRELEVFTPK